MSLYRYSHALSRHTDMKSYGLHTGSRLFTHFLPFDCSLLLFGKYISWDAVRDIVGENDHRTKGCSHETKRNAAGIESLESIAKEDIKLSSDLQSNESTQISVRVKTVGHSLANCFDAPECGSVTYIGFDVLERLTQLEILRGKQLTLCVSRKRGD